MIPVPGKDETILPLSTIKNPGKFISNKHKQTDCLETLGTKALTWQGIS